MIAGMTYYQILWFFLIYSFLGWVTEVVFHAVALGKIINRGFLNGPVCPIYGFGVTGLFMLMNALPISAATAARPVTLFLLGTVFATTVELIGGWALDKLFHARWWDYSNKPFNFHGYICLEFSIIWGLAIMVVAKNLHPFISKHSADAIPEKYGWWILLVFYLLYLADLVVTVMIIQNMNRRLSELDQVRSSMRFVSDNLTEFIAGSSIKTAQTVQEGQVQAALAKAEWKDAAAAKKAEISASARNTKNAMAGAAASAKNAVTGSAAAGRDAILSAASGAKNVVTGSAAATKESLVKYSEELYSQLLKFRLFGPRRLLKAFPQLKSRDHQEALEALRKKMDEKASKD